LQPKDINRKRNIKQNLN